MDLDQLRRTCLALPEAIEDTPFGPGALVFKVRGKMFALIGLDEEPLTISLKCEPELATVLRETHEAVAPGYHLNKRHWVTVTLGGVGDEELLGWIEDSYDLVVDGLPHSVRAELRDT